MKASGKKSSQSSQKNLGSKLIHFAYVAMLVITSLILVLATWFNGWHTLSWVSLLILLGLGIVAGLLVYHQNYHKVISWLRRKFPNLTSAKVLQFTLIAAIILGLVFRLAFLMIGNLYGPDNGISDTGFHWFFAQKIANGVAPDVYDGGYGAYFPHLMTYSMTLAGFMKIFGTGYPAILFSNIIFDLIATLAIYFLLKNWRGDKAAKIGAIIWLLNPLEIVFCAVGVAIVVTNAVLAVSLLLVYLMLQQLKQHNWQKLIIYALLLGACLGLGNAYRPIFTVLLIALVIVLILKIIENRQVILRAGVSLVMILITMFGVGKVIDLGYQAVNPYTVPGGTGVGWNFFVGANYNTWGRWSSEDADIFHHLVYLDDENGNKVVAPDLVGVQKEFMRRGLERYKTMSLPDFLTHFMHKIEVLFADNTNTTWVFNEAFHVRYEHELYQVINVFVRFAMLAGIVLSLVYCLMNLLRPKPIWQPYFMFLLLSFCGLVAASLLVEVMHRYALPLTVLMNLFASSLLARSYSLDKGEEKN